MAGPMDRLGFLARLSVSDIERLFPDTPFCEMRATDTGTLGDRMSQVRGTNPDLYTNTKRKPKKSGKKGC